VDERAGTAARRVHPRFTIYGTTKAELRARGVGCPTPALGGRSHA
jgi:hypothetical protein